MKIKPFSGSILPVIAVVCIIIFSLPSPVYGREASKDKQESETALKDKLIPVPTPHPDHLEEAVSRQLLEGRRMVDTVVVTTTVTRQKRGQAFGELGQLYHAYELNDAAEACYYNAVVLDPTSFKWRYSLGYLRQTVGKFSEALEIYRQMNPDQLDKQRAYLVHIRRGECYRKLNQRRQAKTSFDAAYGINPQGAAVLARLGEIALQEKQYEEAVKHLVSALQRQPEANKLHYSLAMAYRGTGDMEKARYHLSKKGIVGVQPPDPLKKRLESLVTGYRVHLLAGKMAFSAGRYVEAAKEFEKAVEADPKKPAARINLGTTLVKFRKYRQAIPHFMTALQLAPDNLTAHFNLGKLYGFFGNHEKAVQHLQIVVKEDPKDFNAHLALANAYRKVQRFDKAFEHYKTALGIEPGLTWAWLDMSSLYLATGKYGEALRVLEEAHSRIPHDGPIAHVLARQLAASPDLSKREGQRALDLAMKVFQGKKDYETAKTVAMAYAQLDRCDKAVEWMEISIDLASGSAKGSEVLEVLMANLSFFKTQRPCRIPPGQ